MKQKGKKVQQDGGQKQYNKQMEKFGQFSQKAKIDAKAKGTLQIGKPASKKNTDDRQAITEMKQLLILGQRKNTNTTRAINPNLRLEFSHATICEYMDHNKAPTGIVFNPFAKVFCSYNEKNIHVWKGNPATATADKIFSASFELGMTQDLSKPKSFSESSRQISCISYSQKYHLYFACTKNFKLLIFNEYLNCVEEMPLNVRLVQQCICVDNADDKMQLITAGVQGCYIIDLLIEYSYNVDQAILLNPKGDSITVTIKKAEGPCVQGDYYKFQRIGKWVKGMTLDLEQGYFVCWSDTVTYFFKYKTANSITQNIQNPVIFEDLAAGVKAFNVPAQDEMGDSSAEEDDDAYLARIQPRQDADSITDVLFYNPMHYFVISTALGHMLVFKWDFKASHEKPQLMHTYKGHNRTVTSMKLIKNSDSSFVSASLDGSIRVWCLDKFICLYIFQTDQIQNSSLGTKTTDVRMLNDKTYAILSKNPNKVTIGQISHLAKSYFISTPLITALSKAFVSVEDWCQNNSQSLITTFDNNSVLLLKPDTGEIQSTIYPPPTPANIQKTLYSMSLKRVFVFLQSGTFCVYKVDGRETATLEKLQDPKQLKDYEQKSLTQTITSLTLCSITPPAVDSEIFGEVFKYNPSAPNAQKTTVKQGQNEIVASSSSSSMSESMEELQGISSDSHDQESQNEHFLVMGLSKGSVIFVKVDHIEHIYARFSVHKQQIDHIHELKKQKSLVTICQENELKIWGFVDKKMTIFRKFNLSRPISMVKVVEDPAGYSHQGHTMILMTFQYGESYFFVWNGKSKNLRIMLPEEEEKWYEKGKEPVSGKEIPDEPKQVKAELLQDLTRKGLLMNGQVEHDEEVSSIDLHCRLQLIVSGDVSGLIKIWNFRRQLIREIKFMEPISAVCFLNYKGDLIVGHKGKLSRIEAAHYLPDESKYAVPNGSDLRQLISKNSAEIPDDFFVQVKQQIDDTKALNDKLKRRQEEPQYDENAALTAHLGNLFQSNPKFGMPMDEFKALLNKDDRKPQLTDKRKIIEAMQARLANEKANQQTKQLFQSKVFQNALSEALREQDRLIRVSRPARKDNSPRGAKASDVNYSNSILEGISQKKEILPWRVGLKQNKCPGSTKAIPCNLGPVKPNHPKRGQGKIGRVGGTKTRYQMTQERIMDNVKYFNNPQPKTQMNILMVGQQMEQQSVYSERRPISRKVYRSKGTMPSTFEAEKAASEMQGQIQNFMSASQINFSANQGGVMNIFSTDHLRGKTAQNPYQNAQNKRKNLASANVYGHRAQALSSVTDSMSQPDFSIGVATAVEIQSHSGGHGTAAATDSVRPLSHTGYKMGSQRAKAGGFRATRPGTVGAPGSNKMYRRADGYGQVMRSTYQHGMTGTQGLGDDFIFGGDSSKIKVSMMGRNLLNTASAEYHPNQPHQFFGQDNKKDAQSMTQAVSTPSNGFPMRSLKKNIRVRDMRSQRNAAIAQISRTSPHKTTYTNQKNVNQYAAQQQRATSESGNLKQLVVDTQTKQGLLSTNSGDQQQQLMTTTMFRRTGGDGAMEALRLSQTDMGNKISSPVNQIVDVVQQENKQTGVPTQVIEMNENVRELAITPTLRQSNGNMVNQSLEKEKTEKDSSGLYF